MKFSHLVMIAGVLALGIAPLSAHAQTAAGSTAVAAKTPKALGGAPAAATPVPTATPAAQPAAPAATWTKADVDNMCAARWTGKPKRVQTCIKNNSRRIGTPKTDADAQEIKTGKGPGHAAARKGRRGMRAAH